ncbi:MAG: small multi-drug export protein, partial [Candidatus Aenigmatarchaeota archaeon]
MLNEIALVAFVAMLPVSELRGAIPLGISLGLPLEYVIIVSLFANCLAFFPIYFGLELFYERFFIRYLFCRNLMEKSRKRVEPRPTGPLMRRRKLRKPGPGAMGLLLRRVATLPSRRSGRTSLMSI